jgi:hypothetical protein
MSDGRNPHGHFQPGNQIGRNGGYQRHRDVQWRREIVECVTKEDRLEVLQAIVDAAKGGDVSACKLLWSYWYGRPTMTIDMSVTETIGKVIILPDNGKTRVKPDLALPATGTDGTSPPADGGPSQGGGTAGS